MTAKICFVQRVILYPTRYVRHVSWA